MRFNKEPKSENFIYGFHAVEAVLRYSPHRAKKLVVARKQDAPALLSLAQSAGVAFEHMERDLLEKRFKVGSLAQGVVLLVSPFTYTPLEELLNLELKRLLLLDTWQDAVNLGRAARAALCFGASALVICKDRSATITAASEKAAAGALSRLPVAQVTNLSMAMRAIKERDFFIYGADERGPVAIKDCDFASKVAIVIGQEGGGLRELTKKNCDMLVSIPMAAPDICLNAADTALLFLYELNSRNK
ncbi:MAG TPA: RNA methyltransferase [Myxococcota bacterium]|nr:RNA methyltransferase [Myxococcota bacterium]